MVSDERDFYFKDGNLLWIKTFAIRTPNYLKFCLDAVFSGEVDDIVFGAAYKALTITRLREIKIPLPALKTQQPLVDEIKTQQPLSTPTGDWSSRWRGESRRPSRGCGPNQPDGRSDWPRFGQSLTRTHPLKFIADAGGSVWSW